LVCPRGLSLGRPGWGERGRAGAPGHAQCCASSQAQARSHERSCRPRQERATDLHVRSRSDQVNALTSRIVFPSHRRDGDCLGGVAAMPVVAVPSPSRAARSMRAAVHTASLPSLVIGTTYPFGSWLRSAPRCATVQVRSPRPTPSMRACAFQAEQTANDR
jgi:hypothetical protein